MASLLDEVARRESDPEAIADRVIRRPVLVDQLLDGLRAGKGMAARRFGSARVIRVLSERKPEVLYPRIEVFIQLLDHESKVMQWEGLHVLGNLASVDEDRRIDGILDHLLRPIRGPVLITAANAIGAAARIAASKPELVGRVTTEILKVRRSNYQTTECRQVAIRQAVKAFDEIYPLMVEDREAVVRMVKKQLKSQRPGNRKAAEEFVRHHLR